MRTPEPPPAYVARRVQECRLLPERALGSLEEAAAFLTERGLLTRMPYSALPSLFGAVDEESARPAGRGFDLWPRTRWIWSFQLATLPGVLLTKLHRGKSLYLSSATARVFDPLVRREMATAVGDEARLLDHLSRQGASLAEDVELELGWDRARLRRVRTRLERVGAVVCDGLVFDDAATWHFAPMRRWDEVVETTSASDDPLAATLLAGLRAAVVAPEQEVRGWFGWPITAHTLTAWLSRAGSSGQPPAGSRSPMGTSVSGRKTWPIHRLVCTRSNAGLRSRPPCWQPRRIASAALRNRMLPRPVGARECPAVNRPLPGWRRARHRGLRPSMKLATNVTEARTSSLI